MAIIINEKSRGIIQGITGRVGKNFAERMARHYPNFVGGVTPGKGGQEVSGKPVFNTVSEAVKNVQANTSVIVVAAPFVKEAVFEAADAGIKTMWVYTDGVPVHDTMEMVQYVHLKGARLVGPNSAGLVSPGKASTAELNEDMLPLKAGTIGLVSKSGSLSYEVIHMIYEAGFGFTSVICVGGDPVLGTTMQDAVQLFEKDPDTKGIVMLGEVGGSDEVDSIEAMKGSAKPVVAYIAGHCAPAKKKMGHAGAIVSSSADTADGKSVALRAAGVHVAESIEEISDLLKSHLAP